MLCSRFKQIIFTKSSLNHNVHIRCMIPSRFITKRCLRIEEIFVSLAKNDSLDLRSMAAFKLILKDLNVRRLWSVWTRSQIVNTVVRRCKREGSVKEVLLRFRQAILRPRRTLLLSATAAFRTHGDDGTPVPCENITDNEIEALLSDLAGVDELSKNTLYCTSCGKRLVIDKKHPGVRYCICKDSQVTEESADGWVPYMEAEDVIIWRKEYKPGHGLYAYKVYGRYKEVVAEDFAAVQVDASYRRAWDENVAALSVVEADANGRQDQAVLHWEVQWPKLFANRDYVYIRRHRQFPAGPSYSPHKDRIFQTEGPDDSSVSQQMGPERLSVHSHAKRKGLEADMADRSRSSPQTDKLFVIVSRACEHPLAPETKHAVRVNEYWSHMVVKSTDGAGQAGMEFVLTYYDEPAVGGMAGGVAAWASGRAAPAYLTKMRRAAAQYDQWKHTQESSDGTSIANVVTFASEELEPMAPNVGQTQSSASPIVVLEATRDQSTQTDAHTPHNPTNDTPKLDKGIGTSDNRHMLISISWTDANNGDVSSFQLLARLSFPTVETKPFNMPSAKDIDPRHSYADEKFEKLQDYYSYMSGRMKEPHNPTERRELLEISQKKLFLFIDDHIKDLKRLLFATDTALMSMVLLKLNKKMDTSEAKIKSTQAKIPFGLYTSPEFKCLDTSYYIVSAHNQEDAQMILSSERRPHCYTFRGAFAFSGFYHRHSETTYVGPHAEQFQAKDPSQGLYCHSDDNWSDAQCIYKINPREEFPESVEYEPKVSYWCGPYRYFIPATTDVRCIFSIFSMNFIFRFGYDGITYKSSDLTFMYQNGQVFYTDEPWAGMSCWNWACKWRHNQNMRSNEFFVN